MDITCVSFGGLIFQRCKMSVYAHTRVTPCVLSLIWPTVETEQTMQVKMVKAKISRDRVYEMLKYVIHNAIIFEERS